MKITLTFPYYNQPNMLAKQIQHMTQYSDDVQENLEIIIVDDCSAEPMQNYTRSMILNIRQFRCDVDIPWNTPFVRNLAANQAANDWILFTDIDHLIPNETLAHLISGEFDPRRGYWFTRQKMNKLGEPYRPHMNTVFLNKKLLNELGGEDELLANMYGGQEMDLRRRVEAISGPWIQLEQKIILVTYDVIPDSKVTGLERKTDLVYQARTRYIESRNKIAGWRPRYMSLPWHEIT